jgi:hypothetical protein
VVGSDTEIVVMLLLFRPSQVQGKAVLRVEESVVSGCVPPASDAAQAWCWRGSGTVSGLPRITFYHIQVWTV